jgi:DNA invertase Pin-like site-specific DNA recombinase
VRGGGDCAERGRAVIPCVVYAAKSTPDEKGSTADQLRQVRGRIAELGDREVVAEFSEENVSAYHGNRGPELEAAMAAAVAAAPSELWCFHSSRLARGSGKLAEGRSLMKLFSDLLSAGVQLRSVEDDPFLTNPMLVGVASEMAHKYSADLGAHTTRGKRVAAEAGRWPGGRLDGYLNETYINEEGKARTRLVIDEDGRAPLIRRIFALALEDHTGTWIAAKINREGIRTRPTKGQPEGIPWTRSRIDRLLQNPAYCARLVMRRGYDDEREPVDGVWPPLISPDDFDRLNATPRRRQGSGRPPTRSKLALYKLARCARCGGPMYARVSQFTRADGTRQMSYRCENRLNGVPCDAPRVDAAIVDTGVASHLDKLFIDMEAWQADLAKGADEHRDRIDRELKAERATLAKLTSQEEKLRQAWIEALDADSPKAEAREEAFLSVREKRIAAEGSAKAVEAALALAPAGPPTDEALDLYAELARVVREGDAEDLNDRLRLVFSGFVIETIKDGILVMPLLRDDVVERYADPSGALQVLTSQRTSLMAGDNAPDNAAALMLVTGDEAIRPPATSIHIGTDARTSATYHQAWLYA